MITILDKYAVRFQEKARNIRILIFDIDGVMTDGGIIYGNTGEEMKRFHVRDGQIIKPLKSRGYILGAVTGRESELVEFRCRELGLDFFRQGVQSKHNFIETKLREYALEWDQLAYIGDDLIDIGTLEKSGLSFMPADAPDYLHTYADIVTFAAGGRGVVREAGEFLLASRGLMEEVIEEYKSR